MNVAVERRRCREDAFTGIHVMQPVLEAALDCGQAAEVQLSLIAALEPRGLLQSVMPPINLISVLGYTAQGGGQFSPPRITPVAKSHACFNVNGKHR